MNRTEHLLSILAEECAEVAQRCSKAARFGLAEVQPGQALTNMDRILREWADATAGMEMLMEAAQIAEPAGWRDLVLAKKAKVEQFLAYSAQCGTLSSHGAVDTPQPAAWLVPHLTDFSGARKVSFSRGEGCTLTDEELKAELMGTIVWSAEIFHDDDAPVVDKHGVRHFAIPLYETLPAQAAGG